MTIRLPPPIQCFYLLASEKLANDLSDNVTPPFPSPHRSPTSHCRKRGIPSSFCSSRRTRAVTSMSSFPTTIAIPGSPEPGADFQEQRVYGTAGGGIEKRDRAEALLFDAAQDRPRRRRPSHGRCPMRRSRWAGNCGAQTSFSRHRTGRLAERGKALAGGESCGDDDERRGTAFHPGGIDAGVERDEFRTVADSQGEQVEVGEL